MIDKCEEMSYAGNTAAFKWSSFALQGTLEFSIFLCLTSDKLLLSMVRIITHHFCDSGTLLPMHKAGQQHCQRLDPYFYR